MCTSFIKEKVEISENNEVIEVQREEKSQRKRIRGPKKKKKSTGPSRVSENMVANIPANATYRKMPFQKMAMACRTFKAIFCCGGAGTFYDLREYYRVFNGKALSSEMDRLFGTSHETDVFAHPFLKKCVIFNKDKSFKLTDELKVFFPFPQSITLFQLGEKSYFRLQQTCRDMEEFVRTNRNIWIVAARWYCRLESGKMAILENCNSATLLTIERNMVNYLMECPS